MKLRSLLPCVLFAATSAHTAHAQSAQDVALSETLFAEGRKLMAEGHFEQACPKLAESQRLDAALGTQMNLADCYEHTSRLASAWALFAAASAESRKQGDLERAEVAKARAAALLPRLARLTISLTNELPGEEVTLDGTRIGYAEWGVALPVDLVPHHLSVSANGFQRYELDVPTPKEGQSITVTLPALTALGAAPASSASAPPSGAIPSEKSPAWRVPLSLGLAGAGVVSLGLAGYFSLHARSVFKESDGHCDASGGCDGPGLDARDRARRIGNAATGTSIAGLVLLGAGAGVFFFAKESGSGAATATLGPGYVTTTLSF